MDELGVIAFALNMHLEIHYRDRANGEMATRHYGPDAFLPSSTRHIFYHDAPEKHYSRAFPID
jgi:hypothetical protein